MPDGYETFELVWQERSIQVSFQRNWLKSGHWHLELRCGERLPVTETGYRSCFVPDPGIADAGDVAAFVLGWLDEAAEDRRWQRYLADSRQLKLF